MLSMKGKWQKGILVIAWYKIPWTSSTAEGYKENVYVDIETSKKD